MVQLSHPCMIAGKTIALIRWTFVGTVRLYSVVLVSAVQHSGSAVCVHLSSPSQASLPHPFLHPTCPDHHRASSWAPCAISTEAEWHPHHEKGLCACPWGQERQVPPGAGTLAEEGELSGQARGHRQQEGRQEWTCACNSREGRPRCSSGPEQVARDWWWNTSVGRAGFMGVTSAQFYTVPSQS